MKLDKLVYCGLSTGAYLGNILPAVESRIKVAVLISGGFDFAKKLPEVDEINFAPRVKVPTLMVNGRYDHFFPLETSQNAEAFWGGYSGYFADPDGFVWEVAWNPFFPVAEDGNIRIPGEF